MARALYRNADIYLLDDPLSGVDVEVAKHLFEKYENQDFIERSKKSSSYSDSSEIDHRYTYRTNKILSG
jgi:ABC-type Na+ transport system ATPase subunit NatA